MDTSKFASIDPGKNACGVAVWEDGLLTGAWYVQRPASPKTSLERPEERPTLWASMARQVVTCVKTMALHVSLILEIPQIYANEMKKDPNDLLDLVGVQGAIVGVSGWPVAWAPLPREWKGQLPKSVSQARVDSKLSNAEKGTISWPPRSLQHNVYDAIHLGLVYLQKNGLRA